MLLGAFISISSALRAVTGVGELAIFDITRDAVIVTLSTGVLPAELLCAYAAPDQRIAHTAAPDLSQDFCIADTMSLPLIILSPTLLVIFAALDARLLQVACMVTTAKLINCAVAGKTRRMTTGPGSREHNARAARLRIAHSSYPMPTSQKDIMRLCAFDEGKPTPGTPVGRAPKRGENALWIRAAFPKAKPRKPRAKASPHNLPAGRRWPDSPSPVLWRAKETGTGEGKRGMHSGTGSCQKRSTRMSQPCKRFFSFGVTQDHDC
jgi:hypothetical protein